MSDFRKIAFVGNYLPRKCGIATFTHDLRNAIQGALPTGQCSVLAMNDGKDHYEYPDEVRFEIAEQEPDDYLRAAEYLNLLNVDVVSLQHEFGIYGGPSGSHVLNMLRRLRMPFVSTLHTILKQPSPEQRRVMQELTSLSSRVVVMSDVGRAILNETYAVPERKIDVIPHGIPDMPFADPNFFKDQYSVEGRRVLLTFGLLSPNKGIEKVIEALPQIVAEFPDVVYIVLGATHPNLVREHGEVYRESLVSLAEQLGVSEHVRFFNQFVELEELKKFLGAADIYVTPYLNEAQITSGTLAYAFGCGKAVVSTPYWHAQELLADGRGVLVPFADSGAMAREICGLLHDESRRHAMRKRAYLSSREMVWSKTAEHYLATFEAARKCRSERPLKVVPRRTADSRELQLPELGFQHLKRMTDSTGMLQHARFTLPNYAEGYCIDDNARALMLTVQLEKRGVGGEEIAALGTRYASFVDYAFNAELGKFRNFMGYDRRWLEAVGSEDSQARALWALGTCVGHTQRREIRAWAAELFMQALPGIADSSSPRAWAFALLGIKEYLRRLRGDRRAASMQQELAARLVALYDQVKTPDWHWFEDIVSYDNARISQALIATAGKDEASFRLREVGLESLRWLVGAQRAERGHFRPIGSNGFYRRGEAQARFDQQPLEAHATVSACSEAFQVTGDRFWIQEARRAFGWFLGQNDLDTSVYNPDSGGCRDGLHVDRVNLNEGAESTLAFLTALVEIQALETRAVGLDEVPESGRARSVHDAQCGEAERNLKAEMIVRRTNIVIRPNAARVLFRPFNQIDEGRIVRMVARVMSLRDEEVTQLLEKVMAEFRGRHHRLQQFFLLRFEQMRRHMVTDLPLSEERRMLIGSYFTQEYSVESAALFNPSMVWHPDQSNLPEGSRRFVLSLRSTGEGHISSITFRSGVVDAHCDIVLDPVTPFVTTPETVPDPFYDKFLFQRTLFELGSGDSFSERVLGRLGDSFNLKELRAAVRGVELEYRSQSKNLPPATSRSMLALAEANYEVIYEPMHQMSERIIFPNSPTESNGVEDARFVQFTEDDGQTKYFATYTAYDGRVTFPQILETTDFLRFKISTLNGPQVQNKGMALFPRKINGRYAMLSRQDGENIFIMFSDDLHFWLTRETLLKPTYGWEFVQLGNCGSPIETDAGWLVLSHGVGPMRKYSIGAFLLDREDPTKVIGRLREPLLSPEHTEREGYVPNVVYSCGGQIHGKDLIIPYAMSDYASTFATVGLEDLLTALKANPLN